MTVPYEGGKFDMPILQTPGMTIKRIPLPDEMIRIEALKAAVEISGESSWSASVLSAAKDFEAYIRGTDHKCEDYHDGDTLTKVHDALVRERALTSGEVMNIIRILQNEGILFRERRG